MSSETPPTWRIHRDPGAGITRVHRLIDAARARGDQHRPLVMDCDRAAWEAVRAHWHTPTDKEAAQ